jgi:hypothetical protein
MEIERLLPLSCGSLNQELADFSDEFLFSYTMRELLAWASNIVPMR